MNIPSFDAELKFIEEWIAKPKIVADCIKIAKEENKDDKTNYDEEISASVEWSKLMQEIKMINDLFNGRERSLGILHQVDKEDETNDCVFYGEHTMFAGVEEFDDMHQRETFIRGNFNSNWVF